MKKKELSVAEQKKREQVKEMADIIHSDEGPLVVLFYNDSLTLAERLYDEGYRKQSEGKWTYHECVSSYDGPISGYACSLCHSFVDDDVFDTDEFHKAYCGNCGAKMEDVR